MHGHETGLLVLRDVVEGVRHFQWGKDALAEVLFKRLAGDFLDQPSDRIGAGAVMPALARIEQQRPDRIIFAGARLEIAHDRACERVAEP